MKSIVIYLSTILLVSLGMLFPFDMQAQWVGDYLGDERVLYTETKQVNQFFRRFNCEEAPDGERYYPHDSLYHDYQLRKEYLNMLFDQSNNALTDRIKQDFIRDVMRSSKPHYLDFHGGDWFAEVNTSFLFKGNSVRLTLFLELEEDTIGSKWVFANVYFEPFTKLFADEGPGEGPPFLHPLSHELDFMNLIKAFSDKANPKQYALKNYQPDYLTLFLYEIKQGNLKFQTVNKVKFHFFQVDNWYFELEEFQREGFNRGWLISQMTQIPEHKKEILLKYIYHQ